jgi:hypothetical protein
VKKAKLLERVGRSASGPTLMSGEAALQVERLNTKTHSFFEGMGFFSYRRYCIMKLLIYFAMFAGFTHFFPFYSLILFCGISCGVLVALGWDMTVYMITIRKTQKS